MSDRDGSVSRAAQEPLEVSLAPLGADPPRSLLLRRRLRRGRGRGSNRGRRRWGRRRWGRRRWGRRRWGRRRWGRGRRSRGRRSRRLNRGRSGRWYWRAPATPATPGRLGRGWRCRRDRRGRGLFRRIGPGSGAHPPRGPSGAAAGLRARVGPTAREVGAGCQRRGADVRALRNGRRRDARGCRALRRRAPIPPRERDALGGPERRDGPSLGTPGPPRPPRRVGSESRLERVL
jgi:hypothetical protein